MFQATYKPYTLKFKRPSGTSRGILKVKKSYFIFLKSRSESSDNSLVAIGECGILKGLSYDDRDDYEDQLEQICQKINQGASSPEIGELTATLQEFPSIRFGLEMALKDWQQGCQRIYYQNNDFIQGKPIAINGLIWMGEAEFMRQQIASKLEQGFTCLKLKIGAIDFDTELQLIKDIRREFSPELVEIRVDANGAFAPEDALEKLDRLAEYDLHSIEQPIKPQQIEHMALLCEKTPLPIALDEELIGVNDYKLKQQLLLDIKPQYIILKPSLLGGFTASQEWIELAEKQNIPWWITSALESNVGLNAIAQLTAETKNQLPQGLGTGQLYTNNFDSPLEVKEGYLHYRQNLSWNLSFLFQ